jgi:hypothetical protein
MRDKFIQYIGTKIIDALPTTQGEFRISKCAAANLTFVPDDDDEREGYMVIYEDGYVSWSPKDTFEKAYRKNGNLTFGMAFDAIKNKLFDGMRLPQWKSDVIIKVQFPDENSKMTAPYLYVESRFGRVPWKETMIELFSENWEVV